MTEINDLLKFVEKERLILEKENKEKELLSIRALESSGQAICGLIIVNQIGDMLELECSKNNSRIRPGDRLILKNDVLSPFKATLYNIFDNGRKLQLIGNKLHQIDKKNILQATEDSIDLTYSILTALTKLQPGVPGWTFGKRVLGDLHLSENKIDHSLLKLLSELIDETKIELDYSQVEAFIKCVSAPQVIGIQGPPGTGKTLVLAFVAEALIRLGKRVVLLAPTHQAINNALTTIHNLFPQRCVKKFGDELRNESLAVDIQFISSPNYLLKEPPDTLIGLTFNSAIHHLMISDQKMVAPNVVIIDEAGQLPLVQGISAGLSGANSFILFGDDMQMPPVFESDLADDPLAISIFSQLRSSHPNAIHRLNVTYRLNNMICQGICSTFYNDSSNQLLASNFSKNRSFPNKYSEAADNKIVRELLSPDRSLIWFEIPTFHYMQLNSKEAELAAHLVSTCLNNGMSTSEIAVVTPFRRQVMLLRNLIKSQLIGSQELPIIDTVERVQGITVEMVIVSLCASDPDYIATISEFFFSPNRINVAVSRAKTKSIIISSNNIFDVIPKTYLGYKSKNIVHNLFSFIHAGIL